jgi:hypothetical protein
VCSRRIVGWRTASPMPTGLPLDALDMELWTRDRDGEAVRGVVHTLMPAAPRDPGRVIRNGRGHDYRQEARTQEPDTTTSTDTPRSRRSVTIALEPVRDTGSRRSDRLALATFATVEAVALLVIVRLARVQWFFLDEWDFLAQRKAGDLNDLFRPHNGSHWGTLPILAYRLLWWMFGLREYLPYLALVVVLHLGVAALMRATMRRLGVRAWIATSAASLFALFGAGHEDIAWAFQIGFVSSLAFGYGYLLIVDRDGPLDRRDATGMLAGLAALMCSGVGIAMVFIVAIALALRRGWRIALVHAGPLAAIYLIWYIEFARGSVAPRVPPVHAAQIPGFVLTGIGGTFAALGQIPGLGVVLGAVLVGGLFLAWRPLPRRALLHDAAIPIGLLLGAVFFLTVTASNRAGFGADYARQSRYLHIVAALLLPPIALGAEAIARRRRPLPLLITLLFVVGIPGNIAALARFEHSQAPTRALDKQTTLWFPRVPYAGCLSPGTWPDPITNVASMGWLLDGVATGRIPAPDPHSRAARARAAQVIAVVYHRQVLFGLAPNTKACGSAHAPNTPSAAG